MILALKILFSFKYDFCDFIDKNSEEIIKCINNNKDIISYYLLSLDILENNSNIDLQYKIISWLIKFGIFLNGGFSYIKTSNFVKLSFILDRSIVYRRMKWFFHSTTIYLVTKWDKTLKNFYITNNVINIIEIYCILLIYLYLKRIEIFYFNSYLIKYYI